MSKRMQQALALLVLLSILLSFWVGYQRMVAEEHYNKLSFVVNEADARSFSGATGKTLAEVLSEMKKRGVFNILFKEASLGSLIQSGDLTVYKGYSLQSHPRYKDMEDNIPLKETMTYLVLENDTWLKNLKNFALPKIPGAVLYEKGKVDVLAVPSMLPQDQKEVPSASLGYEEVGIGFNQTLADAVASMDMGIVPQIRTWKGIDANSMKLIYDEIKNLKNIRLILFNDPVIPGYPDEIQAFSAYFKNKDGKVLYPLGTIEFSDQIGSEKLAQNLDKWVVRLHTISNGEMRNFTGDTPQDKVLGKKAAIDRWQLAVKEREMRALLVRFWSMETPGLSYKENMTYLEDIKNALEEDGFVFSNGDFERLQMPQTPKLIILLIALGVASGLALLLDYLKFKRFAFFSGLFLYLGFIIGYLVINPTLALKAMAFCSVIIFPVFSMVYCFPNRKMTIARSVYSLLGMSLLSMIGALLMVGLLSETLFLVKLEHFSGVKLAHLLPILLVPFLTYIWMAPSPIDEIKNLLNQAINYRWAILSVLALVAISIYLARTGNDGMKISETETAFRQFLTDYLGVRPRNKEFIIGYPLTLVFFHFGAGKRAFWILTIPMVIGQVSLVNTYAHLHTPLAISLLRSFNGMLLGIIFGVLLLLAIHFIGALFDRYLYQYFDRSRHKGVFR
jgi:hypothetical protein